VPQRIADALEFVDVNVKQRDLLGPADPVQLPLEPLLKQYAVGQAGQCIVVREVCDSILGLLASRDVLVGGDLSTAFYWSMCDLD
jgi:hypothetical protein